MTSQTTAAEKVCEAYEEFHRRWEIAESNGVIFQANFKRGDTEYYFTRSEECGYQVQYSRTSGRRSEMEP